ncbi:MAG: hypothetical protein LBT09_01060 [Planctomycetaceae bacterium]|nr:hypothetical protein [Planctomycetaceae bacterium]
MSFHTIFFTSIFVILLTSSTGSFVVADDDPFEALKGLNLKRKNEKTKRKMMIKKRKQIRMQLHHNLKPNKIKKSKKSLSKKRVRY